MHYDYAEPVPGWRSHCSRKRLWRTSYIIGEGRVEVSKELNGESEDPLVYNDLMLLDSVPLQISRHHLAIVVDGGRVGVVDRGSSLGSWVDGQRLGGPSRVSGPVFFTGSEGDSCAGQSGLPFQISS